MEKAWKIIHFLAQYMSDNSYELDNNNNVETVKLGQRFSKMKKLSPTCGCDLGLIDVFWASNSAPDFAHM